MARIDAETKAKLEKELLKSENWVPKITTIGKKINMSTSTVFDHINKMDNDNLISVKIDIKKLVALTKEEANKIKKTQGKKK